MAVIETIKVIKHGTHGYWDVFYGDGWYSHFKVRYIKRKDVLIYVDRVGHRLYTDEVKEKILHLIMVYKPFHITRRDGNATI